MGVFRQILGKIPRSSDPQIRGAGEVNRVILTFFPHLQAVLHRRYAHYPLEQAVECFCVAITRFQHDRIDGHIGLRQQLTAFFNALLLNIMRKAHPHFLMKQARKTFRTHVGALRKFTQGYGRHIRVGDTFRYFVEHRLQQPAGVFCLFFFQSIAENFREQYDQIMFQAADTAVFMLIVFPQHQFNQPPITLFRFAKMQKRNIVRIEK